MPKFIIEQIAINPPKPAEAANLLREIGLGATVKDTVVASGHVFGEPGKNTAKLEFAYPKNSGLEFETLQYVDGPNWLDDSLIDRSGSVSHIGMHIESSELAAWNEFFKERGIPVAQSVQTESHTNEFLVKTGRKYSYVIFDTRPILGVDLKFIIRVPGPNE